MSARPVLKTESPPEAIARVRDGVFFTRPHALPRGRHRLSREQVAAAQHERLLVAVTELLAARGYRGFGAREVAMRAGVSLAAFYGCFDDKDDCVFAGYGRFIEVLLKRLMAVDLERVEPDEFVPTLAVAYLETLQSDPVVAVAYQVEIDSLGAATRERRRDSLELFAAYVRDVVTRASPRVELPWSAYLGAVYAVRQLASDALDEAPAADLSALGEDMRVWLSDLFRQRSR
jgi:AcrR family transcriptional regulator